MKKLYGTTAFLATLLLFCPVANALVTFDWATVANPGNHPDQLYNFGIPFGNPDNLRFGSVANIYYISKHEVTNDQYAAFLNSVDPTGTNPNNVYSNSMGGDPLGGIDFNSGANNGAKYFAKTNRGNKPVNYVSFLDCMRFVNWLENGQPADGSGTETGVYAIDNGVNETRSSGATFFIPSEDEWYKAAYYQPAAQGGDADDYWFYPTASNSVPTIATANAVGDISNPGANVANYNLDQDWVFQNGGLTTVASAGLLSTSYYGTFDQGGNVWEWTEAVIGTSFRGLRGGSLGSSSVNLTPPFRFFGNSTDKGGGVGFRVASIPEPSTRLIGLLSLFGLMHRRHRSG